jgi:hypothetical protein
MKKKFLILTPSFTYNSGGVIVLHKLCDILNKIGEEAYIFKIQDNILINPRNYKLIILNFLWYRFIDGLRVLKTNPNFNTPKLNKIPLDLNEWVVIYPETIIANPLNAKHVVRWLLHNPDYNFKTGLRDKPFYYNKNELYFKTLNWIDDIYIKNSHLSKLLLSIFHIPFDLFNENNVALNRSGSAYLIRKGKNKPISHDLNGSICIDGMKLKQIALIFKKVKYFYCYDTHTSLSQFAAMCGTISIVIPDKDTPIDKWLPDPTLRYGIAYGVENIDFALDTRNDMMLKLHDIEKNNIKNAYKFIAEVNQFFSN